MELTPSKPIKQERTLPPKRGRIKKMIIKGIVKSTSVAIVSVGKKLKRSGRSFTTSNSSTSFAISSGYNSDRTSES
ncbi:hypothetical protein JCGZ_05609 [Jatropha curcas]|uniref:Uncharacterized protein n=1 Tax=Jatropha curcas TaxID=180498 RepID=A0A067L6U4_JATCU|nr:hypothetical protein JCGZ_05609 [Jatropha curcas]